MFIYIFDFSDNLLLRQFLGTADVLKLLILSNQLSRSPEILNLS